jgi:hypothetical protein
VQALSSQPPVQNSTELLAPSLFFITFRCGSQRQHPVLPVAAGTCSPSRCPGTGLIYPPIARSSHSNGYTRYNIYSLTHSLMELRPS